jgi:geranyl-CoA carboxylase alpha subunit
MTKFNKILIANRGEIAVRVIRTARDLGYRTVAVYSDADADALFVHEADQAVHIGASNVAESYLSPEKIINAAKITGAQAIHPGYGFLSENADFSKACADAGITFIGPDSSAIELMGSKRLSKIAMIEAGVPCIQGYQGADQSEDVLVENAKKIGFPLMVKASAGGGGRGMRLVWEEETLLENIKTARSEAETAFGSSELILEQAIIEPRHIEIQVFADNFGNVVYLGERDCSIQRRHQKVVEEAPSPFVSEELRQKMGQAAVDAAKSCQYKGAGTVEFLVDNKNNFFFLEMNTRLQVEHPVTELITGLDLVQWQLLVASGEKLPLEQNQITLTGHAIEVRLYAEDPRNNFMPQTGTVFDWYTPANKNRKGVRIDQGIQKGQVISQFYDPMLAKVIAYGENRAVAIRRLSSAVQDTTLLGVNNNKLFLKNILDHDIFAQGEATTAFIEQHFTDDFSMAQDKPSVKTLARAAVLFYKQSLLAKSSNKTDWTSSAALNYALKLSFNDDVYSLHLSTEQFDSGKFQVSVNEDITEITDLDSQLNITQGQCVFLEENIRNTYHYVFDEQRLYLDDGLGHFTFDNVSNEPADLEQSEGSGQIKASMDGAIVDVLTEVGQVVTKGQTLVVLEAMKMEHQLKSMVDGVVESINVEKGQQVKSKQLLLNILVEQQAE